MRKYITPLLTVMLAISVSFSISCEPKISPYDNLETVYLKQGEPAPFDGFLFDEYETEFMLKKLVAE